MEGSVKSKEHTQEDYGLRPEASQFPMMLVLSFVYPCNAFVSALSLHQFTDSPRSIATLRICWRIRSSALQMNRVSTAPISEFRVVANPCFILWEPNCWCMPRASAVKLVLITNGSLFNEDNSRALLEAGVDMIEFSVDACDEATYSVVRKGLEWSVLVENVKRMLALRDEMKSTSKIVASCVKPRGRRCRRGRALLGRRNWNRLHDQAEVFDLGA